MGFEGLDLLLTCELLLEGQRGGGGAAGLLDLAVDVLDLVFEADLQVVGPVFELEGLRFEELGITF